MAVGANLVRLDAGTRARQVPKAYAQAVQQTVRDAMVMAGLGKADSLKPEAISPATRGCRPGF